MARAFPREGIRDMLTSPIDINAALDEIEKADPVAELAARLIYDGVTEEELQKALGRHRFPYRQRIAEQVPRRGPFRLDRKPLRQAMV